MAEIVRREARDSGLAGRSLDDMPDCFRRDPFSPHPFRVGSLGERLDPVGTRRISSSHPRALRPCWHWDGTNMFSFADQVRQNPVVFLELKIVLLQPDKLRAAESAPDQ